MEVWIARLGYLAVLLGTAIEGETVMIAGGVAAQRGLLALPLVMLAGFAGAFAADQTWFRVGQRIGQQVLDRFPALSAKAAPASRAIERWGALFVVGFRFVYGARTVSPLLLGAASYPTRRFVALNALGGALWAVGYGYAGFGAGAAVARGIERLSTPERVAIGVGALLVAWGSWRAIARRRAPGSARPS